VRTVTATAHTVDIDEILFPDATSVQARAHYLGERIDLKALDREGDRPLGMEFRQVGTGYALVFRYGSVVTLGVQREDEIPFLNQLTPYVSGPVAASLSEDALLVISTEAEERLGRRSSARLESVGGDIGIRKATTGRLQIVAEVLAKSLALQHFEEQAGEIFERIEPLAQSIRAGQPRRHDRQLFHLLSDATVTLVHMAGRVEIRDKPDLAWDRPDLDRLYEQMSIEYELRDRDVALTRKLGLISQTTDTFFHISQARRTHRVEWYITILIIIEIVLGLMGVWR